LKFKDLEGFRNKIRDLEGFQNLPGLEEENLPGLENKI